MFSARRRKLTFEVLDVTGGMPELEQSCVDCVVDAGLLDELVITQVTRFIARHQIYAVFVIDSRHLRAGTLFLWKAIVH